MKSHKLTTRTSLGGPLKLEAHIPCGGSRPSLTEQRVSSIETKQRIITSLSCRSGREWILEGQRSQG